MGVGGVGNGITLLPILVTTTVIVCYLGISMSPIFSNHNNNPIRLVIHHFQTSIHHHHHLYFLPSYPFQIRRNSIKAIYQFGDSISDTGNIIRENPRSSFGNLPYGETFFGKPTGRCSNGLLMIDYISKFFNLSLLDPHLNKDGNFSHGVNFAVAGATALNCSTLAKKGIGYCPTSSSLLVQIDWFKSHLHSICSNASGENCKNKLEKALIMMGEIGGNDYNWAFFQKKPISEINKLVPEVLRVVKTAIKEVIDLGAVRIVVPGNFPIGCMTIYLEMFKTSDAKKYDELKCLKHLNEFAQFHNDKLQQVIREVQKDHPNVTIVYADYYSALREILRNAASLGFDTNVMQTACCAKCGGKGVAACENPSKHISWDHVHLTQHAYEIMAKWLIEHNFRPLSSTS